MTEEESPSNPEEEARLLQTLPASVDWKFAGKVTPVKDQGDCGSAWAFSAVGAIESALAVATGLLPSLSVQQLVDCDARNHGCSGGSPTRTMRHYIHNNGLCNASDYS